MASASERGKVYLIGAGPGDPELITVKGRRCLEEADVIIYDYLANPRLLAHGGPDARRVYVGKKSDKHTVEQESINTLLIEEAGQGNIVARLKGGDVFIFGRGGEEALTLAEAGIDFEVVPGVSSASAVPAYAGIPVTHRGLAADVSFITGRQRHADEGPEILWDLLGQGGGTLVFLMGVTSLPEITEKLRAHGRAPDTPAAVIRWGTTTDQECITGTLADIADKIKAADLHPPGVIVVGQVVTLRDKLKWFEKKPLFGRRVVITRAAGQAGALSEALMAAGADVIDFPTLTIRPVDDYTIFDAAIATLQADPAAFDWTILTSANAVRFLVRRLQDLELDVRTLGSSKLAAVGTSTAAAMAMENLRADLVPKDFRVEGLLSELGQMGIKGKNILIPRAEEGREILPNSLRELGARVTVAPLYKNAPAETPAAPLVEALDADEIDYITFTSGSTVKNFLIRLVAGGFEVGAGARLLGRAKTAIIGPVAAKTAERFGMPADVMPTEATIPALVEAIIADAVNEALEDSDKG